MTLKDQVITAMRLCMTQAGNCRQCPYDKDENGNVRPRSICIRELLDDFELLVSDMENTIKLLEEK